MKRNHLKDWLVNRVPLWYNKIVLEKHHEPNEIFVGIRKKRGGMLTIMKEAGVLIMTFLRDKANLKKICILLSFVLLLSLPAIFGGCTSNADHKTTAPTETVKTPEKGTVTLEVLNADGTPCPDVQILYTDLPHEVTATLGSTDVNGRYVWENAAAGDQSLIVQYGNDRVAVFEDEIKESDFDNTIVLKASQAYKIDGRITPTYTFASAS